MYVLDQFLKETNTISQKNSHITIKFFTTNNLGRLFYSLRIVDLITANKDTV